jgi:hypothetical protein
MSGKSSGSQAKDFPVCAWLVGQLTTSSLHFPAPDPSQFFATQENIFVKHAALKPPTLNQVDSCVEKQH